jgi:hypothetical protein
LAFETGRHRNGGPVARVEVGPFEAGDALGDSLYEAVLYVKGNIKSLGADARIEPMGEADFATVRELLDAAGMSHDPKDFKRVASARSLYHWNAEADQEY